MLDIVKLEIILLFIRRNCRNFVLVDVLTRAGARKGTEKGGRGGGRKEEMAIKLSSGNLVSVFTSYGQLVACNQAYSLPTKG